MKLHVFFAFLALPAITLAVNVCQNEVCSKFSADLSANSMNRSIEPCDNFYEYICGNYPAHHPLDRYQGSSSSFTTRQQLSYLEVDEALLKPFNSTSKVLQYIKQLYSECVHAPNGDPRGVRPLIDVAENVLGSWPMIRKPKSDSKVSRWPDLFADVYSKLGLDYIFRVRPFIRTVKFQAGPIHLNPDQHFEPDITISNEAIVEKYRVFLHQMASILETTQRKEKVSEDIEKLIHFEQQIEKIFSETAYTKDDKSWEGDFGGFKIITQESTVDWLKILNRLIGNFDYTHKSNTTIRYSTTSKVTAINLKYIQLVSQLLNTTPIDVIQNFFGVSLVLTYGSVTTKKLHEAVVAFDNDPLLSFPADCQKLPKSWPLALGRIYVETHFSPHEKADAIALVSEIKASFKVNLQTNTWLDATTKKAAIEKLNAMKETIAYADWILNDTRLDDFYPQLEEEPLMKGQFLEKLIKWKVNKMGDDLKETLPGNLPGKTSEEDTSPVFVNAFYTPGENSITIPAAILQPPFFDHEMPWPINYGAIGAIIGHELTHGFDSRGSQFDKAGHLKNWWSNDTLTKFHNLTACFRDQYSAIHEPITNLNVNGTYTLGENIADHGGVNEAFGAYQSHLKKMKSDAMTLPGLNFTSDQLYFVGYANVHCETTTPSELEDQLRSDRHSPERYRVNVVLGNTPQFAKAFNCPLGSKMNPVEKCSLW